MKRIVSQMMAGGGLKIRTKITMIINRSVEKDIKSGGDSLV